MNGNMTSQDLPDLGQVALDYGSLVSRICRRMISDEEVAKEAAQQVWIEITKSYPSFKGQSKISTWIYTITRRVAADYSAKEKCYSARTLRALMDNAELKPPQSNPQEILWVKEMCNKCLTGILHCLDNESRLSYVFREIARLSYDDISEIFEKDAPTIRKSVSRSRRKVQSFLKDRCMYHDSNGSCKCRMKKWIVKINLHEEYLKLRETVSRINVFKESDRVLPKLNYWNKIL